MPFATPGADMISDEESGMESTRGRFRVRDIDELHCAEKKNPYPLKHSKSTPSMQVGRFAVRDMEDGSEESDASGAKSEPNPATEDDTESLKCDIKHLCEKLRCLSEENLELLEENAHLRRICSQNQLMGKNGQQHYQNGSNE